MKKFIDQWYFPNRYHYKNRFTRQKKWFSINFLVRIKNRQQISLWFHQELLIYELNWLPHAKTIKVLHANETLKNLITVPHGYKHNSKNSPSKPDINATATVNFKHEHLTHTFWTNYHPIKQIRLRINLGRHSTTMAPMNLHTSQITSKQLAANINRLILWNLSF